MGRELVSGVGKDTLRIDLYSEQLVTLIASLDVYQRLRLLADVGTQQTRKRDYALNAKISFFDELLPTQQPPENGVIDLFGRK